MARSLPLHNNGRRKKIVERGKRDIKKKRQRRPQEDSNRLVDLQSIGKVDRKRVLAERLRQGSGKC